MPNLVYSVADFQPFTKILSADVNSRFNDIKTLLNTTKLDSTNIQQYGLSLDRLAQGTPNFAIIRNGSGTVVETQFVPTTAGGTGFSPTISPATAGEAIVVNNTGNALTLGTPDVGIIVEQLSNFVMTITAGETLAVNDAVCLDISVDPSNNTTYRVFKCNSSSPTRSRSFLGFALANYSVVQGSYTLVASANFVTGNSIQLMINGTRGYTVPFNTDNATTLADLATAIASDPEVAGASSNGIHTITVTGRGGLNVNITNATVTGGASQPSLAYNIITPASGQSARIQTFGPLAGFSSLTPQAFYYVGSGGAISTTASNVPVGQALSSTVLFISPNSFFYQFPSPNVMIRSHGLATSNSASATQDSEHFNFTSWTAGTSSGAGARSLGYNGGMSAFNGAHHQLDGFDASGGSINLLFQAYDKSSWTTKANRGTAKARFGMYSFGNFLHAVKGDLGGGSYSTANDKWNGSSWSVGTAFGTSGRNPGTFVNNNLLHVVMGFNGGALNVHETLTATDVLGSATVSPNSSDTGGSCSSSDVLNTHGFFVNGNNVNTSKKWDGASWSSDINVSYVPQGDGLRGPVSAHNISTATSYLNGGTDASSNTLNTTSNFNDTSWVAGVSSTQSRSAGVGSVV